MDTERIRKRAMELVRESECPTCRGTHVQPGKPMSLCWTCKGVGVNPEHPRYVDAVYYDQLELRRFQRYTSYLIRRVQKLLDGQNNPE